VTSAIADDPLGNGASALEFRSLDAVGAYFDQLGRAVERSWATQNNNEETFPAVAAQILKETPIPRDADAVGVLQFLMTRRQLVRQEEYGFGDPPVTLYRGRDFYISALYWLDGTTTIHQHMFSGAFRVLEGSSIHTRYGFSRSETITRRLLVGDLRYEGAELLRRGDVREIVSGDAFIHALFHLDRPSVTIVVRTTREECAGTQFEYLRPGLAFDPFFKDETLDRQLVGLTTLHQIAPEDAFQTALSMIEASDLFGGFFVARQWSRLDRSDRFDDVLDALIRRHGAVAEIMRPAMAEKRRQQGITIRRRLVHEPSHRLFLALLLNLPDRTSVDIILRSKFPDHEPADLLAQWVGELNSPMLRGVSGLRLSDDELNAVNAALHGEPQDSGTSDPLRLLGSKVVHTPLLETLLA